MPYRKHEHRVRRGGDGGGWRKLLMSSDIIGPAEAARGYHRVYLYDEHRCTATVPLGAQLPDCVVQTSLAIMDREREHRRMAEGNASGSDNDVKEGDGGGRELTSAEEMQILTREMAGFLSRL